MPTPSILFRNADDQAKAVKNEPAFFRDLNLDRVCDMVAAGKVEYDLKPLFYTRLTDAAAVAFRQAAMQDLEREDLLASVGRFATDMQAVREHLAQAEKLSYPLQKKRWRLDAVDLYCEAVRRFAQALEVAELRSEAFRALRDYLGAHTAAESFTSMASEAAQLKRDLGSIMYVILLTNDGFQVSGYGGEADYASEVSETFRKFRVGKVKDHAVQFSDWPDMNHLEAAALDFVARLNPEVFQRLDLFAARHSAFIDDVVETFDREVQFYVGFLESIRPFKLAGLSISYPEVSEDDKGVRATKAFDMALAAKMIADKRPVIANDFRLDGAERIVVVTGPNQGGKTTFARMFGQLHYLASLGYPVPGSDTRLLLFDAIYTHFERQESVAAQRGKLEDDLVRIHDILKRATPRSIVILNEIFASTSLKDAVTLAGRVFDRIEELDVLCVCVTFLDELSSRSPRTVSMVSAVQPDNPSERTFKIARRPSDGLAYALSIAQKYRLTYECLRERLGL